MNRFFFPRDEQIIFLFAEKELYELLEKKEVLLKNMESNWKELQEAQELAATKPDSISGM